MYRWCQAYEYILHKFIYVCVYAHDTHIYVCVCGIFVFVCVCVYMCHNWEGSLLDRFHSHPHGWTLQALNTQTLSMFPGLVINLRPEL